MVSLFNARFSILCRWCSYISISTILRLQTLKMHIAKIVAITGRPFSKINTISELKNIFRNHNYHLFRWSLDLFCLCKMSPLTNNLIIKIKHQRATFSLTIIQLVIIQWMDSCIPKEEEEDIHLQAFNVNTPHFRFKTFLSDFFSYQPYKNLTIFVGLI